VKICDALNDTSGESLLHSGGLRLLVPSCNAGSKTESPVIFFLSFSSSRRSKWVAYLIRREWNLFRKKMCAAFSTK